MLINTDMGFKLTNSHINTFDCFKTLDFLRHLRTTDNVITEFATAAVT